MESTQKWSVGRLMAISVVAGGVGVLCGLQPAVADGSPSNIGSIVAADFLGSGAFSQLADNGDGTAFTAVLTYITPEVFLGVLFFDNTDFSVVTDVDAGQSGRGSGSGAGQFTMNGVYGFNIFTFQQVGPYDVSVEIGVDEATTTSAYINQGMNAQIDPFTGEKRIVRTNSRGNQAWGDTVGSLSVYVDDGNGLPGLVVDATGIYGQVGDYSTHTVERIH